MGRYKTEEPRQLTKVHPDDAGLDLYAASDGRIEAWSSLLVGTGLYLAIPTGYVGLIWSRSGLAVNQYLEVGAGCIDSNYRGEIKILLHNFSEFAFLLRKGDRIGQLLTIPCFLGMYEQVDDLEITDRDVRGFGSSGLC